MEQRAQPVEVLAWTEGDGPGRAPAPPRWATAGLAAVLGVTVGGILSSDALCPDHRAWVQGLATVALLGAGTSLVQVLRSQPSAPWFAALASVAGIAIGLIDAVHAPLRGTLIAVGFALSFVLGLALVLRLAGLRRFDREVASAHVALADLEEVPAATGPVAAGAPAPVADRSSRVARAEVAGGADVPSASIRREA